jgi:hypothetical protein
MRESALGTRIPTWFSLRGRKATGHRDRPLAAGGALGGACKRGTPSGNPSLTIATIHAHETSVITTAECGRIDG